MILHSENLSVGYRSGKITKEVLSGLNVSLSEGKLVMLFGSNGSGKSTLIKTVSGLLPVLSGKIMINGKDASLFTADEWAKNVSLVLTERADTGNLDVYSLVALGRIPYTGRIGALNSNDHNAIERALLLTGLEKFSQKIVMELSDGERQRVMIARAMAQETPLVILDEPTAFLDAIYRRKLMEWLKELSSSTNKTFLLSTHDLGLAEKYADALWIITGNDLEITSPEKISTEELLKRISGDK